MKNRAFLGAAGLLVVIGSGGAYAQATAPGTGGAPAPAEKQGTMSPSSKSLSSRLSETGGVIAPKGNVDPGIHAAAPDPTPNSTPVIPPSATGGNSAR